MITISDKRFGELVAKSVELEAYKDIANSQYEAIQRQLEASRLGMKRIRELESELAVTKDFIDTLNAENKSSRSYIMALEKIIEDVKNCVKDL